MTLPTRTKAVLLALVLSVVVIGVGAAVESLWLVCGGAWVEILAVVAWNVQERRARR